MFIVVVVVVILVVGGVHPAPSSSAPANRSAADASPAGSEETMPFRCPMFRAVQENKGSVNPAHYLMDVAEQFSCPHVLRQLDQQQQQESNALEAVKTQHNVVTDDVEAQDLTTAGRSATQVAAAGATNSQQPTRSLSPQRHDGSNTVTGGDSSQHAANDLAMPGDDIFAEVIDTIKEQGRYRTFANLSRVAGQFPKTAHFSPTGESK